MPTNVNRRRARWRVALVAAAALLAYLCLWPVPVQPVAWRAPEDLGHWGPHATNQALAGLRHIDLGGESGPEHVAFGPDGRLYVAVAGGKVLRMAADGSRREVFADTGGRVLGFDFDDAGQLVAADAWRGLLSISPEGHATVLADAFQGQPIRYADAVVVADDGRIYFSDASARFAPADWGGTFEASSLWNAPRPLNEPLSCSDSSLSASGAATPSAPAGSPIAGVRRTCGRMRPQAASTCLRPIIGESFSFLFPPPSLGGGGRRPEGRHANGRSPPPPCGHLPRARARGGEDRAHFRQAGTWRR